MIPNNLPDGVRDSDIVGESDESIPGVPKRWDREDASDPRNEYEPDFNE